MQSNELKDLLKKGSVVSYKKGQIFYALDFKEELYVVQSGYVKRYAIAEEGIRTIESIYGPGYFFPLTVAYTILFNFEIGQESNTYVYQAMTDVSIQGISSGQLQAAAENSPGLYKDLFYEAGRRLRANINQLTSNVLKDDYQKITHQLIYLAEEFGEVEQKGVKTGIQIKLPLAPIDMAEQLNISVEVVDAIMARLEKYELLKIKKGNKLFLPDIDMLKDGYL